MALSVIQIADRLRSEADAYLFMEQLRWPDGEGICPHCDEPGASYIEPSNGVSRKTRTGAMSQRRVWRCVACRKQFSVITGTIFHGTKVPLRTWVLVVFEMCASKNGVAAREVERKYGVCARTAWFMMHRIREAMKPGGMVEMFRGVVEADETYIGGSMENRKNWAKVRDGDGRKVRRIVPGEPLLQGPFGSPIKTAVLSLIDRDTGEVRSRVMPTVTGASLRKAIAEQCDLPETILHTDESSAYNLVGRDVAGRETVIHREDEYVRYERDGIVTTNHAEGYFSQLKRSLDGTHHHVSPEHLSRYLAEFDFRHTTRKISDTARMERLMGQTGGRRLTYKRVTA